MDIRFAGDEADLAALMEEELIRQVMLGQTIETWARERERMREIMRLRTDKLIGGSPAGLMQGAWVSGAEGWE
jgi:hypothetical protein